MLSKIISGGQTGVDQAALQAAIDCKIPHGGWCPPGRICNAGEIPKAFILTETLEEFSEKAPNIPRSLRTEWNVRDSDGTMIINFGPKEVGTEWTWKSCDIYQRPLFEFQVNLSKIEDLVKWLKRNRIRTLNIAGNSDPEFFKPTYETLSVVFNKIRH